MQKDFAPRVHINTLDSDPAAGPRPSKSTKPLHAPASSHPSKRSKQVNSEFRARAPPEEIVDAEQDVVSRTEYHGSQTSFSHSVSPGVPEYQSVEASAMQQRGRSNRRSRRSPANRPSGMPFTPERSRTHSLTIEDSFDELAPAPKPAPLQQRTARLVSASAARPGSRIRDAADLHILEKKPRPGLKAQGAAHKSRKRSRDEITDDGDELVVDDTSGRGASKSGAALPAEDAGSQNPPSLSRRGDISATKWTKGSDSSPVTRVSVKGAVCLPSYRYPPADGRDDCFFLQPTKDAELRALTDDGSPAVPFDWLKITKKSKSLHYHPGSNFVKVLQAMEQAPQLRIGHLMVLKFASNEDASWVVDWAREHLKISTIQEDERYCFPPVIAAAQILLTPCLATNCRRCMIRRARTSVKDLPTAGQAVRLRGRWSRQRSRASKSNRPAACLSAPGLPSDSRCGFRHGHLHVTRQKSLETMQPLSRAP